MKTEKVLGIALIIVCLGVAAVTYYVARHSCFDPELGWFFC
jgi:hypothetical protein